MKNDGKVKFYVMVGIPACGKSTVVNHISKELKRNKNRFVVISPDDIRKELTGSTSDQSMNKEVFGVAHTRVRQAVAQKSSVIFDATSTTKKDRKNLLKLVKSKSTYNVAVFVDTKISIAKKRNSMRDRKVPNDIIDKFQRKLTIPTIEEGFHSIIRITPSTVLKNVI